MNFFILGLASLTQKAAKHSQSKAFSEQREGARPDLSPAPPKHSGVSYAASCSASGCISLSLSCSFSIVARASSSACEKSECSFTS